jgi:serine phosphatase RsbU (regulator of sigma subunit)
MEIALTVIFAIIFFPVAIYAFHLSNRNYSLSRRIKDVMHQKAEINNFLNLFSKSLNSMEEIDNSMNLTARYIADSVEAESVCIFETDGQFLRGIGVCGVFPLPNTSTQYAMTKPKFILDTLKRERIAIGTGFIGKVAATQQPLYIEDTADNDLMNSYSSFTRIQTVMAIPMVREGKTGGVIVAVNTRTTLPFSPEQFARFKFMAGQVMLAQDMVHIYANLAEQQRIEQELEFARQIQASLLPKAFPAWGQFAVHSQTRSSKEVNGDFYDFVAIDDDRLLIVVGDACGKGIPACMITAMTRSFIRAAAEHFTTLENMLKELNNNLFRDTDEERFVTLGCCLIDKQASIIEYARAGHTELLTFIRGHIRKIIPDGTGLGLLPRELASFDTITFKFTPGMTLLLFTDGITEALSEDNEEFGIDRLSEKYKVLCIDNEPLNAITNKLLGNVDSFTNNARQLDDQTLVVIRHI